MYDSSVKVLTAKGGSQQISPTLYDYLCLTADRKLFVNDAYPNHAQVLNKISYFRQAGLFDGNPIPIAPAEIRAFYDKSARKTQESSQLQRDIADLFAKAASQNVSDVMINVRKMETLIQFKTSGDLQLIHEYTAEHGQAMQKAIFMTMCEQTGKTFQAKTAQEARMKSMYLPDNISGLRIATQPTDSGTLLVARLLKEVDQNDISLTKSGYAQFQVDLIDDATSNTEGIIVFAGPTGSGKSTTMSGIMALSIKISQGTKHVVTIENPVEYLISAPIKSRRMVGDKLVVKEIRSWATQIPITGAGSKKTKEKFGDTVRSLMRLAPDIIMIGEVRDGGSVKAAVDASLTGHFVVTSTHASYAGQILKRLMTVGATGDEQISKDEVCDASVFTCFICQRLVKSLCQHCARPLVDHMNELDPKLIERLNQVYDGDLTGIKIYGDGCPKCSGLFSRTVLAEIINTDQRYMENYLQSIYSAETYWLEKLKGIPMKAHGLIKVKNGIVDPRHLEGVLGKIKLDERIDKKYFNQLILQESQLEH